MKRLLRNLPIKYKFMAITVVISGVALLVAITAFAIYEQAAFKRTMARDFVILADMFNDNVAPGLAFSDFTSIDETLQALAANRRITAACVYDKPGEVVATYRQTGAGRGGFMFPAVQPAGQRWGAGRLDTFANIDLAGEVIGTIYIGTDLGELRGRLWRYAAIVVLLLVGCSLVALGLATRLQGIISRPIEDLAQTVATIAATKDYSVRARKESADELGRLIDGFNEMLGQIQARDSALGAARDNLEKRVEDRTVALKLAREEAVVEQLRFKLIFDAVPVGISYYSSLPNGELGINLINDAHLHICGLTREQGQDPASFKRISHPDDSQRQLVLDDRVKRREIDRYSIEKRYLRPDGQTVWVTFNTERKYFPDGGFVQLSTVADITELKLAQEAIARKEAKLRFIFEAVPFSVSWVQYHEGKNESMVNSAFYRITGLSPGKLTEIGQIRALTHPDDLKRQDELRGRLDRGEIDDLAIEKRYLRADGATVWVQLSIHVFRGADGRIQQEVSTLIDITERKQAEAASRESEERFSGAFEYAPIGVALVSPSGRWLKVNRALCALVGYSEAELLARTFQDLTLAEDLAKDLEQVRRTLAGEVRSYQLEKRYVHANGHHVPVWLNVSLVRDEHGQPRYFIAQLLDISERKHNEAALEKAHAELVAVSRQAGMAEIATGVLHNVGNVLNSVNVSATLVAEQVHHSQAGSIAKLAALFDQHKADLAAFLTADARGRMIPGYLVNLAESLAVEKKSMLSELEHLRKNIEHIKDIVSMQQSFSRSSGVIESVCLPDLIEDALRINAGALARHAVDLIRDYQVRPVITTDKHKVLQILINLLQNAKHACDESGRTDKQISVRTTGNDRSVQIAITDNGVGIPAENLARIFNHGFPTRKTGHGFGLHTGALAARELGGALTVQSAGPGHGAIFTLELPLKPDFPSHENAAR